MTKLKTRKEFIKNFIKKHIGSQVFFTRNILGDSLKVFDKFEDIIIEYCEYYNYYEIFNLKEEEKKLFVFDLLNKIKKLAVRRNNDKKEINRNKFG